LLSNGETLQISVRASPDPAELGPQDYVVIAVKAPSLPEVASRIGPLLGPLAGRAAFPEHMGCRSPVTAVQFRRPNLLFTNTENLHT
jgi:hypothetical protein